MMDCRQFRRSILTDPSDQDPALRAHRESCAECAAYARSLLSFEERLGRALRVTVPAAGGRLDPGRRVVPLRRAGSPPWVRRGGWMAMAASVLFAAVVAGGLWIAVPSETLARDVVEHMAEEPQAWARTDVAVPLPKLADAMQDAHVRLAPGAPLVSYANRCGFRHHNVPHLVVQTEHGPVTVMVLTHEHVWRRTRFDEEGYRGVIVPMPGHGSLAVLSKGGTMAPQDIDAVAARVRAALVWTGSRG